MWAKSSPKLVNNKKKPNFSCTSFKDIQLLISDDNNNNNNSNNNNFPPSPIFQRVKLVNSLLRWSTRSQLTQLVLPNTQDRVVIFYTSLHVIRATSDACRTVRSILRSFPIKIDERDLSMDHTFVSQLHQIFPPPYKSTPTLPKVFIAGKFVGGADEIRALHESGELNTLLAALPTAARAGDGGACGICGGFRFVLCEECSGSRKCFSEKTGGFRTCGVCNENGLVRCNSCA